MEDWPRHLLDKLKTTAKLAKPEATIPWVVAFIFNWQAEKTSYSLSIHFHITYHYRKRFIQA